MKILLLQGPLGPFFDRIAKALIDKGHQVYRIHLNAGDRFYSQYGQSHDYNQRLSEWPDFLRHYIDSHAIDTLMLYGDCRLYHKKAIRIAKSMGCACKVFEEGYLRPDWITCENFGVNAASTFLQNHDFKKEQRQLQHEEQQDLTGNTFPQRCLYATGYFLSMWYGQSDFPHYKRHHINPSPRVQALSWLKNFYRKFTCKKADQKALAQALKLYDHRYFLLPLQVATDSQISAHSSFTSIEDLITFVVKSFAVNAPRDTALLIKHHPVDRGHTHYGDLIKQLIQQHNLGNRIVYGHDWHLPDVLRHTQGVVTLNSTVGISGLIHYLPVKVLGRAFWDIDRITDQQALSGFWMNPRRPDKKTINQLLAAIRYHTQFKGSFYRNIDILANNLSDNLIEARKTTPIPNNVVFLKTDAA